jgi:hypothetical protein
VLVDGGVVVGVGNIGKVVIRVVGKTCYDIPRLGENMGSGFQVVKMKTCVGNEIM